MQLRPLLPDGTFGSPTSQIYLRNAQGAILIPEAFGVEEEGSGDLLTPKQSLLHQNYLNPFNTRTVIHYQLATTDYVKLEVYNTLGQKVVTLVSEKQQAGYKSVIWDGADLSSGLYLYKLTAGDFAKRKIMTLVK